MLLLLPFGAILLPILGWVIGVIWLWQSQVWSRRHKLIGTLVFPGGCGLPLLLNWQVAGVSHANDTTGVGDVAVMIIWVLALAAPLCVAAWLAAALRRGRHGDLSHDSPG